MPMEIQNVPISLQKGLNLKSDNKQSVPGEMIVLENAVMTTIGEYDKRNGYEQKPNAIENNGGSLSSGYALSNFKEELLAFSKTEGYSFSESTQKFTDKGEYQQASVASIPITRGTESTGVSDSAFSTNGTSMYAWGYITPAIVHQIRYSILDNSTSDIIVSSANAYSSASVFITGGVKTLFIDGNFVIIYGLSNGWLNYFYVNSLNPKGTGTTGTITTNLDIADPTFDATIMNGKIFVSYNDVAGGGAISMASIDGSFIVSNYVIISGTDADGAITIFPDTTNGYLWIAYYDDTSSGSVKYLITGQTGVLILTPTTIETISLIINVSGVCVSGVGTIFYEHQTSSATQYNNYIKRATAAADGTVSGSAVVLRSVGFSTKPFIYNSTMYMGVVHASTLQSTYFVIKIPTSQTDPKTTKIIAKFAYGLSGGIINGTIVGSCVPEVNALSSTVFQFGGSQRYLNQNATFAGQPAAYASYGAQSYSIDFDSEGQYVDTSVGNNLHLNGGFISMYDGQGIVEHGFHLFPEPVLLATSSTTGGHLSAGAYQYAICYEWQDNQGQTHRSSPSIALSFNSSGGGTTTNQTTLTIPYLRLTSKISNPVAVIIYRTAVNGTVFYQLTSGIGLSGSAQQNDVTADSFSYNDTVADSSITGNNQLYTTGGAVENIAAPATAFLAPFKTRLIAIPYEDSNQIWFSKEVVPGQPVEFSELFVENIDSSGGANISAIQMDDKFIILKSDSALYMVGDGPSDAGTQNDYSVSQVIACDVGCDPNSPKSPVLTPIGVMFKSKKGIYLLDRSLKSVYIGAPVEGFNSKNVVSSRLHKTKNQVRFCLDDGSIIIYDYFVSQWYSFTGYNVVDSISYQDDFTFIRSDGTVMQENDSVFTDNGSFIKMKLQTSWLSLAGVQGFQRVRKLLILGEYLSPHKLLVGIAYDFDPTTTQNSVIDVSSIYSPTNYGDDTPYGSGTPYGGTYPVEQFRVFTSRQKCDTAQITIEDAFVGEAGQSLSISNLSFEVGVKKGLNKLPATRSVG